MRVFAKQLKQQGFTIVELMIATTVFAVVLLICTYGLLEIGRAYYKGVTITRTQETARIIIDDVAEAIQFSGGQVVTNPEGDGWHCIGNKRYSFEINRQHTDSNHALVTDSPPASCSGGTTRQNEIDGGTLSPTSRELMNTRTRLSRFSIEGVIGQPGLYRVTVRVVTGDIDVLVDDNNNGTPDDPVRCKNERSGSEFCAVSELTTVVQRRL